MVFNWFKAVLLLRQLVNFEILNFKSSRPRQIFNKVYLLTVIKWDRLDNFLPTKFYAKISKSTEKKYEG